MRLFIFDDILQGIHSGFPPCCILNYIELELKGEVPGTYMHKFGTYDCGYVPCLKCLKAKNFVKVKKGTIDRKNVRMLFRFFEKIVETKNQPFQEIEEELFFDNVTKD